MSSRVRALQGWKTWLVPGIAIVLVAGTGCAAQADAEGTDRPAAVVGSAEAPPTDETAPNAGEAEHGEPADLAPAEAEPGEPAEPGGSGEPAPPGSDTAAAEPEPQAPTAPAAAELGLVPAVVTRVVDGDTIVVTVEDQSERVRFVGVDTPEVGEAGADAATAFTRDAIAGAGDRVYLERDGNDRDRFGRLRRNVWLAVPASSQDPAQRAALLLNVMLVDAGHAVASGAGASRPAAQAPPAAAASPAAPDPAPEGRARFRNCTEVWEELGRSIRSDEPGFHSGLDRDGDGVGCERDPRR